MHINEPKSDLLKALGAEELPVTIKELKVQDIQLPTMIDEMDYYYNLIDEMDYYYKLNTMTPEEKEALRTIKREALNKLMNVRLRGTNDDN